MKVVALIPARGGSKSIPLKNIKPINGRPLVYWVIDAAVSSKYIEEVYVSTDSNVIKETVEKYDRSHYGKLRVIGRSESTATDNASTESVMIEFCELVPSENLVLIQATSPLTTAEHIDEAFEKFEQERADSLLTVVRQKRFIWNEKAEPINYDPLNRPRRQDFKGYLVENGAFYITKTELFKKYKNRLCGKITLYEMPEDTFFEIDEPLDFLIVERLLANKHKIDYKRKIKLFATDCDGVLTDGGMYYSPEGDNMKKFNTKDGMGLSLLKENGIITAIITGEDSEIVKKRAKKLNIDEVYLGCKNKVAAMEELLKKYNFTFEEVAYIGDDINDLDLLKKVGLSLSVNDAIDIVKQNVHYVTKKNGGEGAVREAVEFILNEKVH